MLELVFLVASHQRPFQKYPTIDSYCIFKFHSTLDIPGVPELPHDILITYSGVKIKRAVGYLNGKLLKLTNRVKLFSTCFKVY
jgi:hypothetical protein